VRWFIPPAPLPIEMDPTIGVPVLMFAVAVTIVSVLAFGLVPAMQVTTSVGSALKESASTVTASPRRARVRQALVAAQVALSLVLLVSAGLFMRTLQNAQAADPGFSTRNGLLASIDLLPAGYDASHGRAFLRDILARVREIPGVDAASLGETVPLGFGGNGEFGASIDGYTPGPNEEMTLFFNRVGSDYLKTMGILLVTGREFSDRDTAEARDIAVVNETLTRRYFGGRNPIGGRIRTGGRTLEIVGVARDGKYSSITEAPRPYLYLPVQQWYAADTVLHVKTAGDPAAIVAPLYRAFRDLDANVPLFDVRTIHEQLEIATFMQRMFASLLGAFGTLALVLSTVGLYGVIAALAVQRTPEIGMRMALGATPRHIVSLIVRQGLAMTGVGVGLGLLPFIGRIDPQMTVPATTGFLLVDAVLAGRPAAFLSVLAHLLLPALALALALAPLIMRVLRSSLIDTYLEDYIALARLRGVGKHRILAPCAEERGAADAQPDWRPGRLHVRRHPARRSHLRLSRHRQPDGRRGAQPRSAAHTGHRADLLCRCSRHQHLRRYSLSDAEPKAAEAMNRCCRHSAASFQSRAP